MVASTDIKFYLHTNTNAPQLQNAFGSMINVLDACLVNGFGARSVSTLMASGTIATATFSTAHNYMKYQVIKISDAEQAEFNGEHRILSIPNANTITFELSTTASVTSATGSITCSLPSLGWEKPFGAGGKAAYRSTNTLLSSRPYLRVIDELDPSYTSTFAKYAKVGIVEDMSDIDTMLGVQAPYTSSAPNRNWVGTGSGVSASNGWSKWYYASTADSTVTTADSDGSNAGNRNWILVGNKDYFYILPAVVSANTWALTYGFGSFKTLLNTDTSNTFLSSTYYYSAANSTYQKSTYTGISGSGASNIALLQRSYSQTATPRDSLTVSLGNVEVSSGYSNYFGAYSLTNIAPFAPVFLKESVLRGELFGFYWLFQARPYNNYQLIEKNNSLYIAVNAGVGFSLQGQVVLKIGDL